MPESTESPASVGALGTRPLSRTRDFWLIPFDAVPAIRTVNPEHWKSELGLPLKKSQKLPETSSGRLVTLFPCLGIGCTVHQLAPLIPILSHMGYTSYRKCERALMETETR